MYKVDPTKVLSFPFGQGWGVGVRVEFFFELWFAMESAGQVEKVLPLAYLGDWGLSYNS